MSRKRPTVDQMGQLLSQPHFQRDDADTGEQPSNVPVSPTPMLVDVDQIVPYDRNPRRAPNDNRDELKAYIKEQGVNQVLTITQRPDTDRPDMYMIGVGGNTRLTIIQELWHETQDERFKQVWCQFQPWSSEPQTLIAHIQDNDLRGDLVFVDRAIAVAELRDLLEAEAGEPLSIRGLREQLNQRGYKISRAMLGWYQYTVDTLHPLIPNLLRSGIGRPTIAKIHEMQRAFGKAWQSMGLGEPEEANNLFEQTLQRHDGDAFDVDVLRRDLEEELSISADCDIQRASLELGGALYGRSDSDVDEPPTPPHEPAERAPSRPPASRSTTQTESDDKESEISPAPPAETRSASTGGADKTKSGTKASNTDSKLPAKAQTTAPAAKSQNESGTMPEDIKSLRSRAWTLASRIAQGSRLGDIVEPIGNGIGYLVGPVPVETQQSWHPDAGRSAMCVWWHLATLAEQFARHGQACDHMPPDWSARRIGDAMRQARDGEQPFSQWQWEQADRDLFADVPPLEPSDIGPLLYHSWPEQRWNDWIQLVETYREIYRITGESPWGEH